MKLRQTVLQVMDKKNPALYDLAILEVCESHDRQEEEIKRLTRRNETLEAMLHAGSEPSLKEN